MFSCIILEEIRALASVVSVKTLPKQPLRAVQVWQAIMRPVAPAPLYHNDTILLRQIWVSGDEKMGKESITNELPGMLRWKIIPN